MKKQNLGYVLLIGALVSIGFPTTAAMSAVYAQQPSGPIPGGQPTFVVHIPANAYRQGNPHYDPLNIAVPVGTTVQFANDDPNQVHTVTSGTPGNATAAGKLFDSGVMNEGSAFLYTFNKVGDYSYYCKLHPWMIGSVSVSGAYTIGHNIRMNTGTGAAFDFTKNNRTLLTFAPLSLNINPDQFATYNITILKNDKQVFSKEFSSLGGKLSLELIPSNTDTKVYGPDIEEPVTGAYHVQGSFLKDNASYKIQVQITKIGDKSPPLQTGDEFGVQIVPEFPLPLLGAMSALIIGSIAVLSRTSRVFKTS
jgi:plastocyanin